MAVLTFLIGAAPLARAQMYAGVLGGIANLSGDARSVLNPTPAFASYDPKYGPAVQVFLGRHLSDYFTVQGEYTWNGNRLNLSQNANGGTSSGFEETRTSSQHSVVADLLVYFRARNSRLRPYLAVGTGVTHFSSTQDQLTQVIGSPVLPPARSSNNYAVLHVPVGIDVSLGKGWAFRYTFSETLSMNPIDPLLSPSGQHRFMNFQNLFGFVKRF
jgi:Outer membrane protein beta-barrel domain